ncbi:MAG: hypothetical protein L0H79_06940 [Intrasporangium sp.]|uniref:hypothetical protein n=1 Tax=Intrasporangium sp. TaxID=1925024 RepID=UPI002647905E|nr:hypothetical protein [Intrasporangium sp.]MDN5795474.1 hypothetical protein [Intrasporangium sp.]
MVAPPGAYANIPAWSGRHAYLALAAVVLQEGAAVLAQEQVSAELLLAYLRVRTGYVQEMRTGRRCIVRPKVLATVLDVAENTVHRCQRAARALGLEVVVLPGRMLTASECIAARLRGSSQRGLCTEVAFTVPRRPVHRDRRPVDVVTPTSGRASRAKPDGYSPTTKAASGKADATPSRQRRRRAARLASTLIDRLPWLYGESPGRCGPALSRFAHAPVPWTAEQIVLVLADGALRRGITRQLRPERIATRPAVVLAGLLRVMDEVADHPDAPPFGPHPAGPITGPEPCTRADCDGHGWIQLEAGTVVKCPACSPATRSAPLDDRDEWQAGDDDEPPF